MLLPSQKELPKIPSEFIEQYVQQWLMIQLEYFHYRIYPYATIIANLDSIQSFISHFGGIHSTLATNNAYFPMLSLNEDQLREFVKKLFKDKK